MCFAFGYARARRIRRALTKTQSPLRFDKARVGGVMSGRRSPIKGYFGVARVVGAVMSSVSRGQLDPLALMLSADPLPRSEQRA